MSVMAHRAWDAERVTALRKRLRLTQDAFAQRLGVWQVTVSRWESGTQKPGKFLVPRLDELAGGRR